MSSQLLNLDRWFQAMMTDRYQQAKRYREAGNLPMSIRALTQHDQVCTVQKRRQLQQAGIKTHIHHD